MSTVSNKMLQAAAGNNGEGIGGELIEIAGATSGNVHLSAAPQAGDLLIAGGGTFTNSIGMASGFTHVRTRISSPWSDAAAHYIEIGRLSYKIATGNEGTSFNMGGTSSSALAVYRFNSPVTSVTIAHSSSQSNFVSKTLTVAVQSSHTTYPQIYACAIGAYNLTSLALTNQDFSNKYSRVTMAATLLPEGHTPVNLVTSGNGSFNEACVYVMLVPNFN